jgi:diguanylate cyclase (GGDEF)-like protein/PAS domain S-box-containing protein
MATNIDEHQYKSRRCELVDNIEACLLVSLEGEVRYASRGAHRLLNRVPGSLAGAGMAELFAELPLRAETPGYNLAYVRLNYPDGSWRNMRCQGAGRWLVLSFTTLQIGSEYVFLVSMRARLDPIDMSPDLERLITSESKASEGVFIVDAKGAVVYVNHAFEVMTGFSEEEIVGRAPDVLEHEPAGWEPSGESGAGLALRVVRGLRAHRRKNGAWYFAEESARPFVDVNGQITHYVCRRHDVSGCDKERDRLLQLAHFDGLTELPNRSLFLDRLHQEIIRAQRRGEGFTLLFIDVDGFKAVNDAHGHAAGDALLREVALRLQHCVRNSDTVARMGGDEFSVILSALVDREASLELLAKIEHEVIRDLEVDGVSLPVSVSIGVARFPEHGECERSLLQAADVAMYRAKRSKSARWSFFERRDRSLETPPA